MPDLSTYGDRVVPFELASPEVSSSEVRERVAAGETIDDLVPPAVARVIEELGSTASVLSFVTQYGTSGPGGVEKRALTA